ncbi:universal stress protein [Desulfosarcina ovata]|uniref:UspA domain-containing protein n=2 Tax=Desulfosarcina ovata TaxID=83564 RepID=A0A5K8AL55_9BACT|nr:universal stress protein [Desulfosarcina ovata]BBO86589.1 hypothetical protein DSCO28_71550 [Desulfosarcina ovata subsp. sediminis]BBO93445.1 hypothetical protein DSCOOX_66250 [Desulfosarcina ovata subsp. ovata]
MENDDKDVTVRKILLPLKFSQTGSNAFKMALNLAGCCAARLDILSVVKPVSHSPLTEKKYLEKIQTEFHRFKAINSPRLGSFQNYQFAWQAGDSATEILKYAERNSVDIIILGCHYRNNRPCYNRLGEVAQLIFQWASCAVMLVPGGTLKEKPCYRTTDALCNKKEGNHP